VTVGTFLMVSLGLWYLIALLVVWRCLRGPQLAPTPHTEVALTLQAGQTILGVMEQRTTLCFCIGTVQHASYEEERKKSDSPGFLRHN
jgi:hypothetical protein